MSKYFTAFALFLVLGTTQAAYAGIINHHQDSSCSHCHELAKDTGKTEEIQHADSAKHTSEQFNKGFQDGYRHYQPNAERVVGLSVLLVPMFALPGCIYYTFKKVSEKNIPDSRYQTNSNVNYRSGYVAGASKRRRVAAWSCFGGAVGVFAGAGAALSLLLAAGNAQ